MIERETDLADMTPPDWAKLRFTSEESETANREWKASCGPHTLAAVLGKTLDQVRPHLGDYRGWMNPTQIGEALLSMGQRYTLTKGLRTPHLCDGINRIQWVGPWLNPGVHPAAAYAHTHWVAQFDSYIYCTASDPTGWQPVKRWRDNEEIFMNEFYVTHHYRMERPKINWEEPGA